MPALAARDPRIIVEPVLDDGRPTIRVSITNDSLDPMIVATKARPPSYRCYDIPCAPLFVSNGASGISMSSPDGTTLVVSTPEPRPSLAPISVETTLVVDPGTTTLSRPAIVGEIERAGGASSVRTWDVYAVIVRHEVGSVKRFRIVSSVEHVNVPPTMQTSTDEARP